MKVTVQKVHAPVSPVKGAGLFTRGPCRLLSLRTVDRWHRVNQASVHDRGENPLVVVHVEDEDESNILCYVKLEPEGVEEKNLFNNSEVLIKVHKHEIQVWLVPRFDPALIDYTNLPVAEGNVY